MTRYYGPFEINGKLAPADARSWQAGEYEDAVVYHLERILQTTTGRAVFHEVIVQNVRIRPEESIHGVGAQSNGLGDIYFTPGKYVRNCRMFQARRDAIGYGADEVLLHELFHAMRKKTSTEASDIPTGMSLDGQKTRFYPNGLELYEHEREENGTKVKETHLAITRMVATREALTGEPQNFLNRHDYDSIPEFNAILVCNTFMSEKNRHMRPYVTGHEMKRGGNIQSGTYMLRKDHDGKSASVPMRDARNFLDNTWVNSFTEMLWNSQTKMCRRIALAPAEFNPLRHLAIAKEPERFMIEFLRAHDVTKEGYRFFHITLQLLAQTLPASKFRMLLNGRRPEL